MLCGATMYGQTLNGTLSAGTGTFIPPQATFASAPSSPPTGAEYTFTDASAAGVCTGGGTSIAKCRWSGSTWQAVGGGGGGGSIVSPGGITSLSYSNAAFSTAAQCAAVTIVSGISSTFRFAGKTIIQEDTQFTVSGSPTLVAGQGLTFSIGTTATCTVSPCANNIMPPLGLAVSGGQNYISDTPNEPQLTPASGTPTTYSLYGYICAPSGTNLSAYTFTAGRIQIEVAGYTGGR